MVGVCGYRNVQFKCTDQVSKGIICVTPKRHALMTKPLQARFLTKERHNQIVQDQSSLIITSRCGDSTPGSRASRPHSVGFSYSHRDVIAVGLEDHIFRILEAKRQDWRQILASGPCLLFSPHPQPDKASESSFSTRTHVIQDSFVHALCYVPSEGWLQQLRKLGLKSAIGGEEDEQRHGELKVFQEVRVSGGAGSQLRRSKRKSRTYIRRRRRGAGTDEFDELET
jgi:hypothetical protein